MSCSSETRFQKANFKELELNNQSLQDTIKSLESENINLRRSLSFKIGSAITFPVRFLVGLFQKNPSQNPIKASIDSAFYSQGVLDVSGWALSDSDIMSIKIYSGEVLLGETKTGSFREDVMRAFPDKRSASLSGFQLSIQVENEPELIEVHISDSKGFSVKLQKVVFPSFENMSLNAQYQIYQEQNPYPSHKDCEPTLSRLKYQPLISIIVPVFNTNPEWLNRCFDSVLGQYYQNWELCVFDDASTSEETKSFLKSWVNKNPKIKIQFGTQNSGISVASNAALELAEGEFVALLDHDDELCPHALLEVVNALSSDRTLDFIYSDEDKIETDGSFSDPHFKSDFNPDALLCQNYICHLAVIRKSLGDSLGWFREGFNGSQDFDLFLRVTTKTNKIFHLPKVLYHWRKADGSTAKEIKEKEYVLKASKHALNDYCTNQKIAAEVVSGLFPNSFRIKRKLEQKPLISVIIPFRNELELLQTCVDGVLNQTDYKNIELLLVNNQSSDPELLSFLHGLSQQDSRVKVLDFNEDFNYSKLNNWAVTLCKGDFVLFLNNDIEVIHPEWLESLVEHIIRDEVSAVGAKLLYPDLSIQHAGVVVNSNTALHVNKGLRPNEVSYFQRINYIQNVSACTAACLLVKKDLFLEVEGFDEKLFKIAYNDVDLCLKFRELGKLIVYTPYAQLIHHESKSRGLDSDPEKRNRFTQELKNYQIKWGNIYKNGDPYFSKSLKQSNETLCLNIQ